MAIVISLLFGTSYWHQKVRPVFHVTAALLCVLSAWASASGETMCPERTRRWSASMLSWVKRFVVVRDVLGCCILASTLLQCIFLAMCGKNIRVSRCTTALTNSMRQNANSARCCSPRPSRRFSKRTMEQKWLRATLTYFLQYDTLCGDMSHTRALIRGQFSY